MTQKNLFTRTALVLATIVFAVWAILPPEKQLRRGKDIAGGSSLVYQVNLRPTDPPDTMSRMVELIKSRVDPQGILEITITPLGTNRLEISMPLPDRQVQQLKAQFESVLAEVTRGTVSPEEFQRILALPNTPGADGRLAKLNSMAANDPARLASLNDAAKAFDSWQAIRSAYQQQIAPRLEQAIAAEREKLGKLAPEAPTEQRTAIQNAINQLEDENAREARKSADAETAFQTIRDRVLSATVSLASVRRALELSDKERSYFDDAQNAKVTLLSPRDRALERLKKSHPEASPKLDQAVKAFEAFEKERKSLDDPQDLVRLLRGSGVLTFRITVNPGEISPAEELRLRQELRERGPRGVRADGMRWYKINKEDNWFESIGEQNRLFSDPAAHFLARGFIGDEFDGQFFILAFDQPGRRLTEAEGNWRVERSNPTVDELGRPAIAFRMDSTGAGRMAELTGNNQGRQMAVLLDEEIYTAPKLQARIGRDGIITGTFGRPEIDYIVRVLGAGALAAKLAPEPISITTIGPELGVENLQRGMIAGVISFVVVSAFMCVYYMGGGVIAVFALLINALLILAIMALNRAAFSLPGIAGVILTFGMAVDANVLIYERMREEFNQGADLRTAVRLGYSKALAAIVDGNLTNLIVCVVLYFTGTAEIKGFAATMTIGVLTTLFCQLFVTRLIFAYLVDWVRFKRMPMLPMVVPAIQRALTLSVDWMRLRWFFASFSILLTGVCLVAVFARGSDVLDNEFRGGTKVTISLKEERRPDNSVVRASMKRSEVEELLRKIGENAQNAADPRDRQLVDFKNAEIVTVNPDPADPTRASTFIIKTVVQDAQLVQDAVAGVFKDKIDAKPELTLGGRRFAEILDNRPLVPVLSARLGESVAALGVANANQNVADFIGGVAIVLDNINPPVSLRSLEDRVQAERSKGEFAATMGRPHAWFVIAGRQVQDGTTDGTWEDVTRAVYVVTDPERSFLSDPAGWERTVRDSEWKLLAQALGDPKSPASVESFSSSIAATFAAQAIVAVAISTLLIVVYIWVRFNSFRYSLAAIATSLHDCIVAVGAIAIAGWLYGQAPETARSFGILPFKIDLNVVAAVLTILGYSLNDTVIVMDRIREMKGKMPHASKKIINDAINQTISRTIITGGTTFMATMILYLYGGEAVRAFAFSFIIGILVGTYSSIAVAAPIVWVGSSENPEPKPGSGAGASIGVTSISGNAGQVNGTTSPERRLA